MPSKIVVARNVENSVQTYSDNLILSSVILHTTVVSTVRPPLGSRRNVIPIKKHLLWWQRIVCRHVIVGLIIKPPDRSIKEGWLHTQLHLSPNKWKKGSCELHDDVFETDRRRLELRALLPFYPCTKRVRVMWRRQYFENISNSIV